MQTVERRSLDQPKLHTTVVITIADKLASHGPRLRIEVLPLQPSAIG